MTTSTISRRRGVVRRRMCTRSEAITGNKGFRRFTEPTSGTRQDIQQGHGLQILTSTDNVLAGTNLAITRVVLI